MLSSNTEIIKTDEFIFEENGWVVYVGKQDYGMTYDQVKIKNNTDYENFSFDIDLPECGYCEVIIWDCLIETIATLIMKVLEIQLKV